MPLKRRPKPYEKGAASINKNNVSGTQATSSSLPAKQKPSSPSFSKSTPNWRRPKNVSNSDYKSRIETLWKNMGNNRVSERQNAIKNGLIADPNKRTTLANAIRVVGTCQDMCPEFERIQRIRENAIDRAEKVTLHNGTKVADEARMVKAFHRPDAGKEEQLPSDLRSPAALQITVRYLLDHVASPASSLAEHHKFVWDRTRCIRNDFTIQASGRLGDIKIAIQCYEEIARFHILSLHQMPKIGKHDYDAQQELEQLSATLLTLFEYYDDNRSTYEAPCEAEFRAYKLLIDIRSRTNDTLERVQTWSSRVRDSVQVQVAVQLCQASGTVYTDTTSMLSPYARSVQVDAAQYAKFWSLLDSPKVDYLMACAASVSFNEIRARALETMAKVYRSGPTSRLHDFSLHELTYSLGLDSDSQTRTLFRTSGLSISKHANGISYLDLDELSGPFPKSAVALVDQIFSRSIVEVKREDRIFGAIYKGLDASYCRKNGLVDESEGEAEFEPDAEDVNSDDEREESLFVDGQEEDENMDKEPSEAPVAALHPFTSNSSTSSGLKFGLSSFAKPSTSSSLGSFGRPSALQAPIQKPSEPVSIFSMPAPITQSTISTNPFQQPSTSSTLSSGTNIGSSLFGQPSALVAKAVESSIGSTSNPEPNVAPETNEVSKVPSNQPIQASTSAFSWKPTATSHLNPFSQLTSQTPSTLSSVSDQALKQKTIDSSSPESGDPVPNKTLFPFAFPASTIQKIENATVAATTTASQPSASTSMFELKPPISTPSSLSGNSTGPMFSVPQSSLQTQPLHSQTQTQPATVHTNSDTESFVDKTASQTPSTMFAKPSRDLQPATVLDSSSKPAGLNLNPTLSSDKDISPAIPNRIIVTPEQKKIALDMIAKDLFLGEYGILEQFIEANLGPIYDKVQRQVTKERTLARLDEIKQSLLSSKFLYVWRWRVDERLRRKKAIQRRERMRRSRYEDSLASTPTEHEAENSVYKQQIGHQLDGQLKYLTRGFHDTFDKSVSSEDGSLVRERSKSELYDKGYNPDIVRNKATARISEESSQNAKRNRHSLSQSVDGPPRPSPARPSSSSMPPPHRPSRSRLVAQHKASLPDPFIGMGFLQNEALRREAIDLARGTGPMTTTASDYFRLKARNIDPNTGIIPSTRKRRRDSVNGGHDRSLSKSRRLSASTISSTALSPNLLQSSAKPKSPETEAPLTNGQSQDVTLKWDNEEETIFAEARKLRETLAEHTQWMRTMREEWEKEEANLKEETPAQRRLREFKWTPSKTSIRLRQTHANGLLPPDYFEKQSVERKLSKDTAVPVNDPSLDSPTPKMGLAALPKDRHKRHRDVSNSAMLGSRGASVDDAIEL